jgi:hypothetical protein
MHLDFTPEVLGRQRFRVFRFKAQPPADQTSTDR